MTEKKNLGKRLKRFIPLYLMMIPGAVYLIINNYIPMTGIVIAFKQFNYGKGIWGSPFIGFKNFEFLFATKDAWIITRNTLLYNVAFIVLGTACAIAVAILLNEIHSSAAKKIYQTTILVPFLISIVVVSYLVYAFLSTESGFLNKTILPALGLEPVSWYTESKYWPFILILVNLWKGLGYNCIIYYATLVGIDRGYYEAAVIDGCGPLRTFFLVVLPMMKPTFISVGVLEIMWVWNDFLLPYLVLDRTKYMTIPIVIQHLKGSYGQVDMGATMALILLSILPVIVFYLLCQKHIIKGVAAGAVKG